MENHWSFLKKIGFLFLFFYFLLYATDNIFNSIWVKTIPVFAKLVGHEGHLDTSFNGSGDKFFHYYQLFLFFAIALLSTMLVGFFDRHRKNYQTLLNWLITIVRYYLGFKMITYGLAKLFYLQFVFPSATKLNQSLGDFSPMGLLWNFMGYSKAYCIFTGALECIGAMFLLNRKTTTLGALITFGVMLNVMMLNYCYDVPVKLLSTHLVVMSLFLIALDRKRLLSFFFTNQKVEPFLFNSIFPEKFIKGKMILKGILISGYIGVSLWSIYHRLERQKKYNSRVAFTEKYNIEKFEIYQYIDDIPTITDSIMWTEFTQRKNGLGSVKTFDGHLLNYSFEADTTNRIFNLNFQELNYEPISPIRYHVYGNFGGDSLSFEMVKNEHLLLERGFNWVNEFPFNR